jgi:hypothetical protein
VDRHQARHRRKDELIDLYHRGKLAPGRPPAGVIKPGPYTGPRIRLKQSSEIFFSGPGQCPAGRASVSGQNALPRLRGPNFRARGDFIVGNGTLDFGCVA